MKFCKNRRRSFIVLVILSVSLTHGAAVFAQGTAAMEELDLPRIEYVKAVRTATTDDGDVWRFSVTVRHNDEGWEHYADRWQVVYRPNPEPDADETDETILGERVLLHPHDNEQPFERSQSGIIIPSDITIVLVRSACTVHGFGDDVEIDLSRDVQNEIFEINR